MNIDTWLNAKRFALIFKNWTLSNLRIYLKLFYAISSKDEDVFT